jgi:uncharacterized protein YecA (UPF0149 family)
MQDDEDEGKKERKMRNKCQVTERGRKSEEDVWKEDKTERAS